jgi:hypothetical protein
MQTTLRTIFGALLAMAVVTSAAWGLMHLVAEARRSESLREHQTVVAARQRDWARERVQREVTAHEAARERARGHERELMTAMGGPAEAAAKNPELSIGESIERVARACAPGGTRVNVRVERFTEFIALVELSMRLDTGTLANLARCILTHSAAYIHRLQFIHRGQLLAGLDRQAIESVADWKNVSLAEVQRCFTEGGSAGSAVAEPNVSTTRPVEPEEEQNLTPEARRQRQASEAFDAALETANERLRSALRSGQQAVDMAGMPTLSGLQARRALLEQAETLASQARAVLEDPAAEYRRLVEAARLDEVYVRSAVRTMAQRFDPLRPATTELFNRFSADLRASAGLIDVLARYLGDWTYDATSRRYTFTSDSAPDIKAALDGSDITARDLASALAQWTQTSEQMNKAAAGRAR